MEQVASNRRDADRVTIRTCGFGAILLSLLWNPLVLPPRFWSARVVIWSFALDAALILIGVGLILLRRWAALLASATAVCLAFDFVGREGGISVATLGLLIPLVLT